MSQQHVVTFIGDDRTGLVEQVAKVIEKHGGNWLESQLSHLGGKFAGIILVSLPEEQAERLADALTHLPEGKWSVRVTPTLDSTAQAAGNLTIDILGPDRPGIVREISAALRDARINILELESLVESAAFTGEPVFKANVVAAMPGDIDRLQLEATLDQIAENMTLEIDIKS